MQRAFMLFSLGLCALLAGCGQPVTQNAVEQVQLIPRSVLFGNPEKMNPQISPDGTRLAYIAPVNNVLNLWIKTAGKNDDHAVSKDTNRGIYMYFWAYDNKHLGYIQDKCGDENWHIYCVDLETEQTVDLTPFNGIQAGVCAAHKNFPNEILITMNKENKQLFDVYHVNISTSKLTLHEKNPGNIQSWIADSNLCVRAAKTFNPDGGASLLIRASEKEPWKVAMTWDFENAQMNTGVFGFSHDGKQLYLRDSLESNTIRLVAYDCASGKRTVLAQDPIFDVSGFIRDSDKKALAAKLDKERCEWVALDAEFAPTLKAMQAVDDGDLIITSASVDNRYWIIGFMHDNQSSKFFLFDKKTNNTKLLFADRPALDSYKLARTTPISFIARDGLKIYGYLTCPVNEPRNNLPLVLYVHGGPWDRDRWEAPSAAQWFANRGYACLQVNYRGSLGYGKAFMNAGDHEWGAKMHDDLIDAINWAVTQGIANTKKIAIYGSSYGGYAALVGATFTPDLFCCAVDICGMSNLITWINSFPPYWIKLKKQIDLRLGNPEKDAEFLKSRSPLFKANNIKIPILIGQGGNDVRVNQTESEQIVAAMKAKSLPYEYVLFPDEGHGFSKPKNLLKFYAIAEKFLAKHLGGRYEE